MSNKLNDLLAETSRLSIHCGQNMSAESSIPYLKSLYSIFYDKVETVEKTLIDNPNAYWSGRVYHWNRKIARIYRLLLKSEAAES